MPQCFILHRVGNSNIKEMTTSPFSSTKPTFWRDLPVATVLHIAQGGKFKYKRNDDLTFLLHKADLLEGLAAVLHIAEEVVGTPCSPQSSDERAPDHRFF